MKKQMHLWIAGLIVLTLFTHCAGPDDNSHFTGIIEAETFSLLSSYSDRIVAINKDEGQSVSEGETLVLMDSVTIFLQFRQNQEMISELQLQIKNARTQLEQAQNQARYMEDLLRKKEELAARNAIPYQQLEDIKLQYNNTIRQLEMARNNIAILQKKLEQARINSEILQKKLEDTRITAPADGIIDKIYYEEGEIPPPFSPVLELINLDVVWCYIYVNESDLSSIQISQEVAVTTDGLTSPLKGRIVHINQQAEFTPKNILTPDNRKALVYGVKVKIDNPHHILKPGMPVEVTL